MARALQDILTELNTVYDPQRSTYNTQIAALPGQQTAEEQGLEAVKRDSFQDITNQANRRGLFYSGIPVAEEQRYTGQTYLPAVANLRNRYTQQKFNLQDALSKITEEQHNKAYGIRQGELDTEAQAAAEAARLAASERAAARAAGAGGFAPSFGGGGGIDELLRSLQGAPGQAAGAKAGQDLKQIAYNDVAGRAKQGASAILSDFFATAKSAMRGNAKDRLKVEFYLSTYPQLFRGGTQGLTPGTSSPAALLNIINGGGTYGKLADHDKRAAFLASLLPKPTQRYGPRGAQSKPVNIYGY